MVLHLRQVYKLFVKVIFYKVRLLINLNKLKYGKNLFIDHNCNFGIKKSFLDEINCTQTTFQQLDWNFCYLPCIYVNNRTNNSFNTTQYTLTTTISSSTIKNMQNKLNSTKYLAESVQSISTIASSSINGVKSTSIRVTNLVNYVQNNSTIFVPTSSKNYLNYEINVILFSLIIWFSPILTF